VPQRFGDALERTVAGGRPLHEALAERPGLVPEEDIVLIEAGEAAGRLDQTLERLAKLHTARRQAWRELITEAWYPILLVHIAAMLLPVANLGFTRELSLGNWLGRVLAVLLPIYAIFGVVRWYSRTPRGQQRVRRFIDVLPGFGAAARHRRRSTFALVFEAAYESGVPVNRCVALAGRAARLPEAEQAATALSSGEGLTKTLALAQVLPAPLLARVATGETAGEISGAMHWIAVEEGERADALFRRSMSTLGKLLYLIVALWIAWRVISFFGRLYGPVLDL